MPKRSETPIEERSYGYIYLILAGLLMLTTFWAVIDMVRLRAPWQSYQRQFNRFELGLVRDQYTEAKAEFDAQYGDRYSELQAQLAEAKAALESPEYKALLEEIAKANQLLVDARQDYRFAKSEMDALWYRYTKAKHEGDEERLQELTPKVEALQAEVDSLKALWDEAEVRLAEVEAQEEEYRSRIIDLETRMREMTAELDNMQERMTLIKKRPIEIKQVVLPVFVRGNFGNYIDLVDRCESCHVSINREGFEEYLPPFNTHPNRKALLASHEEVIDNSCTPCHEGQGRALQVDPAHGEVKHWEHPLLRGDFIQAGCNKCHSQEMKVEFAPRLTKAKRMLFDLGCYGCHEISGFEHSEKVGPDLSRIVFKTSPEFVYRWLRNPDAIRPYTRMPNPLFTHEEAEATTAYLFAVSKQVGTDSYSPVPVNRKGSAARGARLVRTTGCVGCHVITPEDRQIRKNEMFYDIAPDLSIIGSKVNERWLYDWLKNPKRYNPETRMPNLRLSDQEAADIAAYLMTLKTDLPDYPEKPDFDDPKKIELGKSIVRNFGCHGCHVIPGMENEGRVSVSLNEFGNKKPDELFFGDALAEGTVPEKTWEAWTIGKMKNSRVYATENIVQRMPDFAMSQEDAETMALLLKSWDGRRFGKQYVKELDAVGLAIEKGRRIVRKYNCVGCHIIEGEGGDIRPEIVKTFSEEGYGAEEAISFAPPNLIGEGKKVQPSWLFTFLKNPETKIRPWIQVRMPTFGLDDEEAGALVDYFQALDGKLRAYMEVKTEATAAELRAAEKLFSPNYLSCYSCHQFGAKKPEGPPSGWAPDFALAPTRLNPEWIVEWLYDPQALLPGTRMPDFYPESAPPDILGGDPERQVKAIRDFLMTIDRTK